MRTLFETHWAMPAAVYLIALRRSAERGVSVEKALEEAMGANGWVGGAAALLLSNRSLRERVAKMVESGVRPPQRYLREAEEALRSVG
ncbi:MAG: hypothetical protein N3F67_05995 [Acidilobaceae archaeon]|nr:hypothetical protein [Acidilobaceae archaeon]